MKRYLTFINEIGHYPTPIKQVFDIIETFCMNELNKYLNTKGKFYNHNIKEKIDWYEIKEQIKDWESFKKFPVEEINIKFSINVKKDLRTKQSYTSGYQPIANKYNYQDEISSQLKTPFSKLVKRAISLQVEIGLEIQKDAKSIDPEIFKDYIKTNLTHELTHAYQNYQQKVNKIPFTNVWDTMNQIANNSWSAVKDSDALIEFIWLIYKTSFPELNADISASLVKWDDSMDEIVTTLYNFDPEENYKKATIELANSDYDVETVNKNFGKNFIDVYKEACKRERVKPNPKVLKLEDKDMYYIINYWSKIFKKRFEYLRKKLKLQETE